MRLPSAAGVIATKFTKKYDKPLLAEMVACTFDGYWNYSWKGKLIAHYKLYSLKKVAYKLDYTIYVTEKFLQKRYPTKGSSVACSDVHLNNINNTALLNRIHKINSKENTQPFVLGTVASMNVKYKGQQYVIRALHALKKKGIKFNYHLVGQGDDSYLRHLTSKLGLQDQVKFNGPLKHENILDFLNKIDIYIQPSKQEGLPRALVEAMSTACPALGSNIAGIPELLSEESIFKAGDISAIQGILQNVNTVWMIKSAQDNFARAKDYQYEVLENRRNNFYQKFLTESGFK
ncbi:MAG: glycosyltransferase [Bacteroidetes bacterium]|nr:glycosyltransferase [Bacteroidota bacterium]